jgi:hypothetical protein
VRDEQRALRRVILKNLKRKCNRDSLLVLRNSDRQDSRGDLGAWIGVGPPLSSTFAKGIPMDVLAFRYSLALSLMAPLCVAIAHAEPRPAGKAVDELWDEFVATLK